MIILSCNFQIALKKIISSTKILHDPSWFFYYLRDTNYPDKALFDGELIELNDIRLHSGESLIFVLETEYLLIESLQSRSFSNIYIFSNFEEQHFIRRFMLLTKMH